MKKLFISLSILMFSLTIVVAQKGDKQRSWDPDRNSVFFGPGIESFFLNSRPLNKAIESFNVNNNVVLGKIRQPIGFGFNYSILNNRELNGAYIDFRLNVFTAYERASNNTDNYVFRMQYKQFALGMGYAPVQNMLYDVILGMNVDIWGNNISLNKNSTGAVVASTNDVGLTFYPELHFFPLTKKLPLMINARPYYYWGFLKQRVGDDLISIEIADPEGQSNSHIGLNLNANLVLFSRKIEAAKKVNVDKDKRTKKDTQGFQ